MTDNLWFMQLWQHGKQFIAIPKQVTRRQRRWTIFYRFELVFLHDKVTWHLPLSSKIALASFGRSVLRKFLGWRSYLLMKISGHQISQIPRCRWISRWHCWVVTVTHAPEPWWPWEVVNEDVFEFWWSLIRASQDVSISCCWPFRAQYLQVLPVFSMETSVWIMRPPSQPSPLFAPGGLHHLSCWTKSLLPDAYDAEVAFTHHPCWHKVSC